jgi:hypothetical protein
MATIGAKRKKIQPENVLNPFNHDARITRTHGSDGRPIQMLKGSNEPKAGLTDLPNQKGKSFLQYNMPEGAGKRHLAKALKKPLKRRKK